MGVSLCVVACNEAQFVRACIESARPLVGEIIVVDTGSIDRTPAIAEAAGARVVRAPWPGDLASAHNLPLRHARQDWILSLDADEVLDQSAHDELRRLVDGRTTELRGLSTRDPQLHAHARRQGPARRFA